MKKILNIGSSILYDENLNRKIRISNLIASISLVIMVSFIPMSLYFQLTSSLILISFFTIASFSSFVMHKYGLHQLAFVAYTISGYIYFFFATILFGLESNIHYFYLVLCMIVAVVFDKKWILYIYIVFAIVLFFLLQFSFANRVGTIITTTELMEVQTIVGSIITFLLFLITSIFFIFFKSENIRYHKKISLQKEIIEEKHKEITDSINYAERIQRSFLATKELLDENLKNYFVFFQPKDVVSGDFYWASKLTNGHFALACADSTGHGVPGAIMSILNISSLEKSIETQAEPHKILNETRKIIIDRLKKDGSTEGGKDGMDCTLLVFNSNRTNLALAAAQNPVWIIRKNKEEIPELIEFKGDKMPVGKHEKDTESFTIRHIDLQKDDMIYTLTDGMPDQFGGPKGKKYMHKNLKNLLLEISSDPVEKQKEKIENSFKNWKSDLEQIDDVCIVGLRI